MVNFSIVRKGYDVGQVDTYVNKIVNFTESKLLEQKKRIDSLKDENKKLADKISSYEKQETFVSEALINASKKANEIITASKMRYALESERIKLFRAKWTSYVESAKSKVYEIDESVNMQAYLLKMEDELREMIGKDLNIHKARVLNDAEEQFMSERQRLDTVAVTEKEANPSDILNDVETNAAIDDDLYVEKVKEAINSNIKKSIDDYEPEQEKEEEDDDLFNDYKDSREFDISEAMNPGKSLAEICKDLGLI